jgi:hypothetical protein
MAAEEHNGGRSLSDSPTKVDHSLDELARDLATSNVSRGRVLKLMGSALLGSVLAAVPGVAWAAACPTGQTRCNDRCVNLQTNERHCGSCRNRCASNQTCCKGRCVNLQGNERHCGSCFNRCPEGSECVGGVCQAGGGCPSGTTLCGGNCVSTDCPSGLTLNTSTCQCEGDVCPNVSCCCVCVWLDPTTNSEVTVCDVSAPPIPNPREVGGQIRYFADCGTACANSTPPAPGFIRADWLYGSACVGPGQPESSYASNQYICVPCDTPGAIKPAEGCTGTTCMNVPCRQT